MLAVRLFGGFDVRSDGDPVRLTSARAQSLLACLVLQRGAPQRRDHLAFLLWPDSIERQARTNLRHLLHTLRTTIPDADRHLESTGRSLTWRDAWSDVTAFEAALATADAADDESAVEPLRQAVDLYRGELLAGWYDDWLEPHRDQLRRRALAALARLGPLLEARGDLDAAIGCAERARSIDRLDEGTYRALMHRYDLRGDRARAVRVYHECVTALQEDLGVEPSPQTRALYEALLPGTEPAPRTAGNSPLVGRRPERHRLTELWREACSGRAQFVVLSGEPGIGKTRLVDEFRHWAGQRGAVTAAARSYAAEGALAYAPIVTWLREPGVARRRGHLDPAQLGVLVRLLPELSDDPPTDPAAAEPDSRLQLFDAAVHALVGDDPVLLVADDLHAADVQTLQFLHYLLRAEPDAPLLVVATARLAEADGHHPLHDLLAGLRALERCTELELSRLDRAQTQALAERLGHPLPPAQAERLFVETEGNPLFVVETLRAGWPADGDRPDVLTPKVQAVLEARIRQLTPGARDLLGVAAAAGSSVSVDVLTRCRPDGEHRVARDLDELWRRQLLLTSGGDTYDFSHDKLRDVAYRGLSPVERRHHHRTLARVLQDSAADRLDAVAGQIAAHLHAAGAGDEAVGWYVRAAAADQRLYADADAAHLLLQAWEILRPASPSRQRLERELEILRAIPGPLAASEGYASARLGTVLDRAWEISGELGLEIGAPLVRARAMAVLSRSDFDAALDLGAELRARGEHDDVLAVEGDFVQGVAAAWRGETDLAISHLEAALARYRPENRPAHLLSFGQDPQVLCLARLAHLHVMAGRPEQARLLRDRALDLARSVGHPFTLSAALLFAALLDLELPDLPHLRDTVAALDDLRHRTDAPAVRVATHALQGYLDVVDGRTEPGFARIDDTFTDPGRRTAPGVPAMLLRIRLAACERSGRADAARETAQRLLDDQVSAWDHVAAAVLAGRR